MAVLLGLHERQRGADDVGRAQHVGVDHALPVGRVGVGHVAFDVDAGVGYREVDLAVHVDAGPGQALHVLVAAHVAGETDGLAAGRLDLRDHAVDVGLRAGAADDLRAEAGELAGHGLTDALAGAGDHPGPTRQIELKHLPSLSWPSQSTPPGRAAARDPLFRRPRRRSPL